ncbi:MAG TPA: DUF6279 family lipoprotein [Burkholderiales bacterium]|nr:DUF6279 family lipoprotein [Burkholderiales bacterium]
MGSVLKRGRYVLVAVVAALLVVSCAFNKFAYNQADTLAAWQADDYFDLDGAQKEDFQKRFERLFVWHRHEQLPDYAQFMRTARARMEKGTSREDVLWFIDGLRSRVRNASRQAAPEAAALLATLTPAQIENLQRKFEKDNRKYVKERKIGGTVDERHEAESKRIIKQVEDWLSPLNNEQEQRIKALARELPQIEQLRYSERLRRQKELLEVLAHRGEDRQRFTARLTDWMVNWERNRSADFQKQLDASWVKRADLLVAVDRMLTPDQRTASLQRIQGYANDFTQLASQGRGESGRTTAAR